MPFDESVFFIGPVVAGALPAETGPGATPHCGSESGRTVLSYCTRLYGTHPGAPQYAAGFALAQSELA